MNVQIGIATQNDIGAFYPVFTGMLQSQFPGYSKKTVKYLLEKMYAPESFAYWIKYNIKTILLVKADSAIAGFGVIDEPYGGVSFMRWLGIQKEFQRKGLGTQLINIWIEIAKKTNCHKVEVASQPEAREFYKKTQLDEEGMRKCSYFGIDQYVFGKVIGTPNDEVMTR